jgi:hypothetical protein
MDVVWPLKKGPLKADSGRLCHAHGGMVPPFNGEIP